MHKLHYNDTEKSLEDILNFETEYLSGSYVKVIIHNKTNPYHFDLYIDKIEKSGVLDLQIVDDNLNLNLEDDEDVIEEAEDTLSILRKSADQFDNKKPEMKKKLDLFLTSLHDEAISQQD